jgi:hypothetical protein
LETSRANEADRKEGQGEAGRESRGTARQVVQAKRGKQAGRAMQRWK